MKVYIVLANSVVDGDAETSIHAFSTFEKAKEEFDKMVADTKRNDHLMEYNDTVIEESESEFTIYQDGYYSEDHYTIWIEAQEVI